MNADSAAHGLTMTEELFSDLLTELARRGEARRESGAFLLAERPQPGAPARAGRSAVVAVVYYDDLDPACLTGGISFGAAGYSALNARCRRDGLRVVGDIHTHPRTRVRQSPIDAAHPMAAIDGHVALIAPNYGCGPISLNDISANVFHPGNWTTYVGDDVAAALEVTPSGNLVTMLLRFRRVAAALWTTLTSRGSRDDRT